MTARTNGIHHQARTRILGEVARAGELSPRELAERLGMSLGTVSYHVRTLHDTGSLELAGTRQVRGAIAHDYRLSDSQIDEQIAALEAQRAEITKALGALRRARKDRP